MHLEAAAALEGVEVGDKDLKFTTVSYKLVSRVFVVKKGEYQPRYSITLLITLYERVIRHPTPSFAREGLVQFNHVTCLVFYCVSNVIRTYQTDFLSGTGDGHHRLAAFASAAAASAELAAASAAAVAAFAWLAVAYFGAVAASVVRAVAFVAATAASVVLAVASVAAAAACGAAGSFVALVHPIALDVALVDSWNAVAAVVAGPFALAVAERTVAASATVAAVAFAAAVAVADKAVVPVRHVCHWHPLSQDLDLEYPLPPGLETNLQCPTRVLAIQLGPCRRCSWASEHAQKFPRHESRCWKQPVPNPAGSS